MIDSKIINEKYQEEFSMDEPVNFNDILIYPITMENYFKFISSVSVFTLKKNNSNNIKIISMSYLGYLIHLLESDDSSKISSMLYTIIRISTRKENISVFYGVDNNGKNFIDIDGVRLGKKKFDEFRSIIVIQNIPEYDGRYINPDLEKELTEVQKIKSEKFEKCSIEKQMISATIGTSMTFDDIKQMSIRKFHMLLNMIDKKTHYIIYKLISCSGIAEFKQEINHYLLEDDSNDITKNVIDSNQLQNKINSVN